MTDTNTASPTLYVKVLDVTDQQLSHALGLAHSVTRPRLRTASSMRLGVYPELGTP